MQAENTGYRALQEVAQNLPVIEAEIFKHRIPTRFAKR